MIGGEARTSSPEQKIRKAKTPWFLCTFKEPAYPDVKIKHEIKKTKKPENFLHAEEQGSALIAPPTQQLPQASLRRFP
jgi:hypothetical protein